MSSNWESLVKEEDPGIDDSTRARFIGAWNEHREIFGYTLLAELPYALRNALNDNEKLKGTNFDLLLVDEYQDLNSCDLEILRFLSVKSECKIIGTGDDDQSIYSWRDAAPEGIRRFLKDYVNSYDYTLSISLRCHKKIIEWANYVIKGDPDRPKERSILQPKENSADGEAALLSFGRDDFEAKGVAKLVEGLIKQEGVEAKDILILMRTDNNGTFSKPIRDELEKLGIQSFDSAAILKILEHTDNRILLEVLKLFVNPNDSISWASLLALWGRIGDTFFDYIYNLARMKRSTFADTLLTSHNDNYPDAPKSANKASLLLKTVLPCLDRIQLPDTSEKIDWGEWIIELAKKDEFIPVPTEEMQNLLLDLDKNESKKRTLEYFLAHIEPTTKDLAQARSTGVRIMTMGASKGLTVRAAILVGTEDSLIPRPTADLGEERRILYVAMTRPIEYLFCTWASRRRGPTARAGKAGKELRRFSHFFTGGPIRSQNGDAFINQRFPLKKLK